MLKWREGGRDALDMRPTISIYWYEHLAEYREKICGSKHYTVARALHILELWRREVGDILDANKIKEEYFVILKHSDSNVVS